jgi:hypothetical protein
MEPIIRHFFGCLGVRVDTTVNPPRYQVDDVFSVLRPPSGIGSRFGATDIWVFLQLSDATGPHDLTLDLIRDETAVRPLRTFRIDCGNDRLAVRNWAVRLPVIPLRAPMIYSLRLREEFVELARTDFRVEL